MKCSCRATVACSGLLLLALAGLPQAVRAADDQRGEAGLAARALKPDPTLVAATAKLLDDSLTALAANGTGDDTPNYEHGLWRFKNAELSWPVQGGPGTAAAVLWRWREKHRDTLDAAALAKQPWLHQIAVETFDRAIREQHHPDGSFGDPKKPDTHFFALELATSYLELGDSLPAETRKRWLGTLREEVDYLINSNNLPNPAVPGSQGDGWYVNGNIELGETELLYLTGKATGDAKYRDLMERQWLHTIQPNQTRWKGFGLVYLKEPTRADGSDGAAYLSESGGGARGYDGDYTHFQLTIASRFYVASRDPRLLRLMNLLINALLPHVDQSTWILDATHGARHSLKFPFYTCGLEIAAGLGGRADLAPKLTDQFEKGIRPIHLGNAQQHWGNPGIYRSYGCNVAVVLQAAQ